MIDEVNHISTAAMTTIARWFPLASLSAWRPLPLLELVHLNLETLQDLRVRPCRELGHGLSVSLR
jgi:hypothetical protein